MSLVKNTATQADWITEWITTSSCPPLREMESTVGVPVWLYHRRKDHTTPHPHCRNNQQLFANGRSKLRPARRFRKMCVNFGDAVTSWRQKCKHREFGPIRLPGFAVIAKLIWKAKHKIGYLLYVLIFHINLVLKISSRNRSNFQTLSKSL